MREFISQLLQLIFRVYFIKLRRIFQLSIFWGFATPFWSLPEILRAYFPKTLRKNRIELNENKIIWISRDSKVIALCAFIYLHGRTKDVASRLICFIRWEQAGITVIGYHYIANKWSCIGLMWMLPSNSASWFYGSVQAICRKILLTDLLFNTSLE